MLASQSSSRSRRAGWGRHSKRKQADRSNTDITVIECFEIVGNSLLTRAFTPSTSRTGGGACHLPAAAVKAPKQSVEPSGMCP